MVHVLRAAFLVLIVALFTACAGNKTLVTLAPDPDGKVGAIDVGNEAGSVAIASAYQSTTVSDSTKRPEAPVQLTREAVEKRFADALSIQPKQPVHFLLYFDKDTTLSAASSKLLNDVVKAVGERQAEDISVIGHTDTLGSAQYNNELSRRRAQAVRDLLVERGIPAHNIRVTSHGKENPLIPTSDNVYEPRNRRVEVDVR
ncbi:hypothetical protein GMST_05950 [Geomonas silvestris]|uniref:OmpA-like domain-containing protein n=1 Tax=Geomonas silvestris TaxID=2740184 RepID=A0A6V8ME59_9BACT|nr:OmpA family protein [Geomonas silvestris]GFO58270.1 hypothetical protein GMST_05950 [Geomonas silvestris]